MTGEVTEVNIERFHNQEGIIENERLNKRFLIVGAGAIGSFVAMTLAKMGARNITVVDGDTIEEHNLANQMYPEAFIGAKKVDALKQVVKDYSGVEIEAIGDMWTEPGLIHRDIVISCVDNMEVRRWLWDAYKGSIELFVDGRMGAEVLRAFAIDPRKASNIAYYERTLHTQAQATEDRCTAKSIIYTVNGVASFMLNLIKRSLNGERRPIEIVYSYVNDIQTATYRD